MTPHYLRFARTLAMVSGTGLVGCGGMTITDPGTTTDTGGTDGTPGDTAHEDTARDDVATDSGFKTDGKTDTGIATDTSGSGGTCTSFGGGSTSVKCASGGTCMMSFGGPSGGTVTCVPAGGDSGPGTACGEITCGSGCWCGIPAESTCNCGAAVGPLPPPELSMV